MDQFEREELEIARMESDGEITRGEALKMLHELYRVYHAFVQEPPGSGS